MSDHIPDPGKMVSARDVIAASLCMFGAMDTHGRLIETDAILSALAVAEREGDAVSGECRPPEELAAVGWRFHSIAEPPADG